jgi:hypothetical protein
VNVGVPAPAGRSPRRLVRRVSAVVLVATTVVSAIVVGGPATADWTATVAPGSSTVVAAATVDPGPTPTTTVVDGDDVVVSWPSSALSSGTAVTTYTVTRYDAAGAAQRALAGCSGTVTTTSCTETNVPEGRWTHAVTPHVAENWVGAEGSHSSPVTVDVTPPTNALSLSQITGGASYTSGQLWYRGATAGSFRLRNDVRDAGSGPASSTTRALGGDTSGWDHVPSTVSTRSGGGYVSAPFSWRAGTSSQPAVTVTGRDVAGNTRTLSVPTRVDDTGPTGGAISYPDGFTPSLIVGVTVQPVTDAGTGTTNGGGRWLEKSTATMNGSACGDFGPFQTVLLNPAIAPWVQDVPVTSGACHRFRYRTTDNVGNETVTTSPGIVKVRNYQALVAGTSDLTNYWRLSDSGTALTDTGPSKTDGTYVGGPVQNTPGAIIGDADTAVTLDGVDDAATAPRRIANDFSLEVWFRSAQGLGTSDRWQDGAGLLSADAPGVTHDFGVSLMADGRVAAGTGAPDVTAVSDPGYDDGQWHHVVVTREQFASTLVLYVDGIARASITGGGQALSASATLTLGAIRPGVGHFAGSLDEAATYSVVLTAAQVSTHYAVGRPPYGDTTSLSVSDGAAFLSLADGLQRREATVFYRGAQGGSLQLTQAIDKTGAGSSASSTSSALGGDSAGWLHSPATVSAPGGGPFTSNVFTWSAGTSTEPTVTLTGLDDAGRTALTHVTFQLDDAGPTGGEISYADGTTTSGTVDVTVMPVDDAGAGATRGGGRWLQRATASFDGDRCGTFTAYQDHVVNPAVAPAVQSVPVQPGTCASFRYRFTDNLGNQTITTSPSIVSAASG